MSVCYIEQSAGLGDIFFCQKIANHFISQGYEVVWPVIPEFSWISDYLITDVKFTLDRPNNFDLHIPLSSADSRFLDKKIMEAKYALVDLDFSDWQDHFKFKRNPEKEKELFYNVLSLNDNEEYNFINEIYGSPPHHVHMPVRVNNDLKNVKMSLLQEYSMFDWLMIIEKAKNVHLVDTSLTLILENIELKANEKVLYSRYKHAYGKADWSQTAYMYKKDWAYSK